MQEFILLEQIYTSKYKKGSISHLFYILLPAKYAFAGILFLFSGCISVSSTAPFLVAITKPSLQSALAFNHFFSI